MVEGVLQHEARRDSPPLVQMMMEPTCSIGEKASMKTKATSSKLGRSKTFYSIPTSEKSLASSSRSSSCTEQSFDSQQQQQGSTRNPQRELACCGSEFRLDVLRSLKNGTFMGDVWLLRKAMEPHLRRARLARERHRRDDIGASSSSSCSSFSSSPLASTIGISYPCLRVERRFLFCEHSFPMHKVLADVLNLPDLSNAHEHDDLLLPLLNTEQRIRFQRVYDSFVTSVCLPLLHSTALSHQLFPDENTNVTYRYQAFPTIQVSRPDESRHNMIPHTHDVPTCDTILGYSSECLTFHVPLTPCGASNALYTETRPGREDWHPLEAKSIGLAYVFDGPRCLSFYLPNTSSQCSVALTFRVLLYQHDAPRDAFSDAGPGYYEEAIVNLKPGSDAIAKKKDECFLSPDYRNGYPFF